MVPKRVVNARKVNEALLNQRWISNFRGPLSLVVLMEFFQLYWLIKGVVLQPEAPDSHLWRLSSSGTYHVQTEFLCNHSANELTKFIKNLKKLGCSFDPTPFIYKISRSNSL
jgi:hypothetical protein